MAFAWMVVKGWTPAVADVATLATDFKLAASDVDANFGVIANREKGVVKDYSAMIEEAHVNRLKQDYPGQFDGPFGDVQLAHFGGPFHP